MKAAYADRYGPADILSIREMARPEPGPGDILVRVEAAAVTTADWRLRAAAFPGFSVVIGRLMFGLFGPRATVPGSAFAGRIETTGPGVSQFQRGEPVFGLSGNGAHAEYLVMRADGAVARRPEGLAPVAAAALPFGGLAALAFLRDFAELRAGERVLVNGASGAVGSHAVQLARHFGAEVTAVASTGNQKLLKTLGADHVIDYTAGDVLDGVTRYDVILDTVGKLGLARARRALAPGGRFVPIEFGFRHIVAALAGAITGARRVRIGISGDKATDLAELAELAAKGILTPLVAGSHELADIAKAHRLVESRHAVGTPVLRIAGATGETRAA
jgi:NADPH:quinone reductase-like Zn-dependent oxidoreductase